MPRYKQVWFLGAGFSLAAGYPTMSLFRNAVRQLQPVGRPDTSPLETLDQLAAHLGKGHKFFAAWDRDNFEHLASFAALLDDLSPRSAPSPSRLDHLSRLAAMVYATGLLPSHPHRSAGISEVIQHTPARNHLLNYSAYDGQPLDLYQTVALTAAGLASDPLRDPDCVLTTNYDTSLERACESLGLPYDYGGPFRTVHDAHHGAFSDRPPLTILKLHGSVNWSITQDQYSVEPPDRVAKEPFLYLPVLFKGIPHELRPLWQEAHAALAASQNLVFIGYSLPPSDVSIQTLIYSFVAGTHENTKIAPPPEGELLVRVYAGPSGSAQQKTQHNFTALFEERLIRWGLADKQGPENVGTIEIMRQLSRFLEVHR